MKEVEQLIAELKSKGYQIEGSIFKADYTGKYWRLGFWIRAAKYDPKTDEYLLPAFCKSIKAFYFDIGLDTLLVEARDKLNLERR